VCSKRIIVQLVTLKAPKALAWNVTRLVPFVMDLVLFNIFIINIRQFLCPLQCDTCAQGFGNWSVGYCRPCCSPDQLKLGETHCEDCTKQHGTGIIGGLSTFYSSKESTNFVAQFFTVIGLVLLGTVFLMFCRQIICCYCCRRGQNGNRTDLE
jgi:hypothetical protein